MACPNWSRSRHALLKAAEVLASGWVPHAYPNVISLQEVMQNLLLQIPELWRAVGFFPLIPFRNNVIPGMAYARSADEESVMIHPQEAIKEFGPFAL